MNQANDFAAIAALDLSPIKKKLMHEQSGEGWSQARTDAVEIEYRRFLYLMKLYPREHTSPTVDVDTFWHYHILDTVKYADDCNQAFGYFLHHYPYVGMEGAADDAQVRQRCGEHMRELYEATFGEPYPGAAAYCGASTVAPAYCGAAAGTGLGTAAKPAYCGAAATVSYCGAALAKTAYCGAASASPNFGAARTKTAYCGIAAVKTAYCGIAAAKTAYCGMPASQRAGSATRLSQLN